MILADVTTLVGLERCKYIINGILAPAAPRAVDRLAELPDSGDERVRLEAAPKTILDRHLGRPAIQADLTLHRAEADGHIAALIETACRRALEPVMLEDGKVEVVATASPPPK